VDAGLVIAAMHEWQKTYGRLPSSYDWSRTHANRRGGVALKRLKTRGWPSASVVGELFGAGGKLVTRQALPRARTSSVRVELLPQYWPDGPF
jgi:hypothetical protein